MMGYNEEAYDVILPNYCNHDYNNRMYSRDAFFLLPRNVVFLCELAVCLVKFNLISHAHAEGSGFSFLFFQVQRGGEKAGNVHSFTSSTPFSALLLSGRRNNGGWGWVFFAPPTPVTQHVLQSAPRSHTCISSPLL